MNPPVLYIIVPCYNEEAVLPVTAPLFLEKIRSLAAAEKISPESRVLFVDDGQILEENTPDAFFSHPQNPRTQDFLSKIL